MDFTNYTDLIYLTSTPLLTAYLATMSTHLGVFRKLVSQSEQGNVAYAAELPPVSIIITCHNQGAQLEENLPSILEQEYPDFQVIVVDDCSDDHTEDVLKEMSLRYPNLYHTFTPDTARYVSHKKLALTLGVKAAKNEWLLFTEADCKPSGNQWIRSMARNFTPITDIVLGYANYEREKGFFNSLIAYDRFIENIYTLRSVIIKDRAFRGDSCNMALKKSLFLKNRGFEKNLFLQRGEDTLLVNEIATPCTTRVELSLGSIMMQETPFRKKFWNNDKEYDIETRRHMKVKDRINDWFRGLTTFILYFFFLLAIVEIALSALYQNWIILGLNILLICVVVTLNLFFINKSASSIHERNYGISWLFFEPIRVILNCYFWIKWLFAGKRKYLRK